MILSVRGEAEAPPFRAIEPAHLPVQPGNEGESAMFSLKPYNYRTFTRDLILKDLAKSKFAGGPGPGEHAPEFDGRTLAGDNVELENYRGEKNVVLTFGSATCPMTAASIDGLNELYEEYNGDDVQFLFCYVREAHPGDDLPAHRSEEDKIAAAELLREQEEIEMPIIVDDLKGTIHKKYGRMPNATFLIDESGRIAFRCLWTQAGVLSEAIDELLDRQRERGADHAVVRGGEHNRFPMRHMLVHSHRAISRGGERAVDDFEQAMGVPGRLTMWTSRAAAPVAMNPGKTIAAVMLVGGVVTGALLAGSKLREMRMQRRPYEPRRRWLGRTGTTGDYEELGI
jgi:peroxiredoxin